MSSINVKASIIGLLILIQLVSAFLVNFVLLSPLSSTFIGNAAGNASQISMGVLLYGGIGVITIAIAIAVWPVFRMYSSSLALWFLSLGIVNFALSLVEGATLMSMLSLSQTYTTTTVTDPEMYTALGAVVRSARIWAHYTNVLVGSFTMLIFYIILYKFKLVPLALSIFGLIGALLHIMATTFPFFGIKSLILLYIALPLALSQLILGLWLITKGFYKSPNPAVNSIQGD